MKLKVIEYNTWRKRNVYFYEYKSETAAAVEALY